MRFSKLLAVIVSVSFLFGSAYAEVQYSVTPLGALPGGVSSPMALNNAGQVVGSVELYDSEWAFLFESGVLHTDFSQDRAQSINDHGQVLLNQASFGTSVWANGVETVVPMLPGFPEGMGMSINLSGDVAGQGIKDNGMTRHAYIWRNGSISDLGAGIASDLNDSGDVVGEFFVTDYTNYRAALWHNGALTDLGTLPGSILSEARAINGNGEIVGSSYWNPTQQTRRATLWKNGAIYDLNDLIAPGIVLGDAYDINDLGQIVASSSIGGVLLTPVPEPGTILLLAFGALALFRKR